MGKYVEMKVNSTVNLNDIFGNVPCEKKDIENENEKEECEKSEKE